MERIDFREMISGVLLLVLGIFIAVYAAQQYAIGTAASMKPGFFPLALGVLLAFIGLVIALLSLRKVPQAVKPAQLTFRGVAAVTGSIVVFALLALSCGLIPATVATVFVAAFAQPGFQLRRTALLALVLSILCWLIFKAWLDMQLPSIAFLE